MKIRTGFVSNSSSSSFIVSKSDLTQEQIDKIKDHAKYFDAHKDDFESAEHIFWYDDGRYNTIDSAWKIKETDTELKGGTSMTNFDMELFMSDIKVDMTKVKWGDYWCGRDGEDRFYDFEINEK